jgi:lipoate-protein ligase A
VVAVVGFGPPAERRRESHVIQASWLVVDGPEECDLAMARDVVLARFLAREGRGRHLLRLHGWANPCLTTGRGQSIPREARRRLLHAGVTVARRPTGGGWLLHLPGDLSPTWIAAGPLRAGELRGVAAALSGTIVEALRRLGVPAEIATDTDRGPSRAEICFSRADREEVVAGGVKLAGVALARLGRGALVQAAIPLSPAMPSLLPVVAEWDPQRETTAQALAGIDLAELRHAIIEVSRRAASRAPTRWFWPPELLREAVAGRDVQPAD